MLGKIANILLRFMLKRKENTTFVIGDLMKVNYLGGSKLHLSNNETKTTPTTVVAYPTVTVESNTTAAGSVPTQVVNVKTNTNSDAPKALSANDVDVSGSKNSKCGYIFK